MMKIELLFISEEGDRGIIRAYEINDDLDFSSFNVVDTREWIY